MASPRNTSGTITATEVQKLLRTAAEKLSAREEKALRLRHGATVDPKAPLPRRGQANPEARAELLALEIELKQKLAARAAAAQPKSEVKAGGAQTRTREKDKIIRALRRLK